jgi:hypothetical protein
MKFVYSHPDENLVDAAALITVSVGTPLAGYDTDQLSNGTWARPFKIAETTLELRFEFAAPVVPAFAVLGNTNLTVAAVLEGRSTNVWGAAEVSGTFGVPTLSGDGLYSSPFLDLSDLDPKQYWRLLVTGNAAPIILGALHLGSSYRTVDSNYELDAMTEFASAWRNVEHETGFGVDLVYTQASRRERVEGAIVVTAAELPAVLAWFQACRGSARPTFMVPNDEVDDAWYVRLSPDGITRTPFGAGGYRLRLPVRQLSRGLGW